MCIKFGQMAERRHLAVDDCQHMVGEPPDLVDVVADPQHGDSFAGELACEPFDRQASIDVECRRWFVGEQNDGASQQSSGHTHPLSLATGQRCRVTIEQVCRQPDMFENVLASITGNIWIGHTEVVEHRSFEQRGALEDCSDLPAQCVRQHGRQRLAAPRDYTVNGIVEAVEEAEQRRLSRSGWPDDHSDSILGQIDRDISENRGLCRACCHRSKRESGSTIHASDRTPSNGPVRVHIPTVPAVSTSQSSSHAPHPNPTPNPTAGSNPRPTTHDLTVQPVR